MLRDSYSLKRDLILNLISHLGPISRTRLAALADCRPASVSEIIKELLEEKLIVEAGSYSAGHGRRRVMLQMNWAYLCGLGVAFSGDCVILLAAQMDGVVLQQREIPLNRNISREEQIGEISRQVQQMLAAFPDKRMVGVGIGSPLHDPTGYVREQPLLVNYAHYNDWVHMGLKPRLEKETGLPVEIYSGITLPAVAEQRFGAAKGVEDFLCVELSNGIGSSICCNGIPVAGSAGVAGELGHTVVTLGQQESLCYCGKSGCVESGTAYPALAEQIRQALTRGVFSSLKADEELTVSAIGRALDEGDRMCTHYVKGIAQKLGAAIANAVNLLNPELVILYGFMLELGDVFLQALEQSIRENVVPVAADFRIHASVSQQTILPLGAVAQVYSSFLNSKDYRWVYHLRPGDIAE